MSVGMESLHLPLGPVQGVGIAHVRDGVQVYGAMAPDEILFVLFTKRIDIVLVTCKHISAIVGQDNVMRLPR